MLSELTRRHPTRLDLPSESEMRQCVSALIAKQKKLLTTRFNRSRGIAQPYLNTILNVFEENQSIDPRLAWQIFQERHPITDPLPEMCPEEKR